MPQIGWHARRIGNPFALLALGGLLVGCSDGTTRPEDPPAAQFTHKGTEHGGGNGGVGTNDCGEKSLRITFRDAVEDALRSDGGGSYEEPTHGAVHLNAATGRLMFDLVDGDEDPPPRVVKVVTEAFRGETTDRIYTNGHDSESGNDLGCGFLDILPGDSGSAVFEAELDAAGIVRYGTDCNGDQDPTTPRVQITRSADGLTWTVEGTSGVHCKQLGKKPVLEEVGGAGPFFMTLEDISAEA